jgi:hypothetical protein
MAIPGIEAFMAKAAFSVLTKRKQNKGSAFPQMKAPKATVVSRVGNISSGTKSRPVRASGSTIAKNQSMVSNVSGKGFKVKTAVSGLTRL